MSHLKVQQIPRSRPHHFRTEMTAEQEKKAEQAEEGSENEKEVKDVPDDEGS